MHHSSHHTAASQGYVSTPQTLPASDSAPVREFLTFRLGDEEYGVHILRVQEIRSYEKPTALAHAPADILGVVHLRDIIVPIIDMRVRLKLAQVAYDAHTVVMVVNVGQRVVGLVVDSVSDVITLLPEQMRPVPALDSGFASEHLLALGCIGDRMLILLDIEKYLSATLNAASSETRS